MSLLITNHLYCNGKYAQKKNYYYREVKQLKTQNNTSTLILESDKLKFTLKFKIIDLIYQGTKSYLFIDINTKIGTACDEHFNVVKTIQKDILK